MKIIDLLNGLRLLADSLPSAGAADVAAAADALPPAAVKASPFSLELVLVWLHMAGNVVWIGSAIAMGIVMASKTGEPKVRGALARQIYLRVAMPAFALSFLAGGIRMCMDLNGYFVQHHWMHGKLPFALAVIAIHHILGARARKLEGGSMQEAGPSGMLTIALAVCAILAAFFVVLRFPN